MCCHNFQNFQILLIKSFPMSRCEDEHHEQEFCERKSMDLSFFTLLFIMVGPLDHSNYTFKDHFLSSQYENFNYLHKFVNSLHGLYFFPRRTHFQKNRAWKSENITSFSFHRNFTTQHLKRSFHDQSDNLIVFS